ncbi:MAG TPA: hypothetical protein VI548_12515, partial [Chitinophagaceae bacterium]|nr:hypothetical protein [Chitinophagaceae bacterium]
FEPQDHPNDFQYPGGPPVPPYDAAGWTLAYQMGFQFDRILEGFDGPFERNPLGKLITLKGKITGPASPKGFMLNARSNNSFKAVNQLLKDGIPVYRITNEIPGMDYSVGSFYIPAGAKTKSIVEKLANETGVEVQSLSKPPTALQKISPAKIALWDTYGGSMPSGWIRWIMEQFNYSIDVIYPRDIDTGNLKSKYDVIVFVGGSIPAVSTSASQNANRFQGMPNAETIPEEYRYRLGRLTVQRSVPELKKFLEQGGKVVTIGSATNLAYHLKLPVSNALVEIENGIEKNLTREKYYVPGSILSVNVDNRDPALWGMKPKTDVYFDASPVFNIAPAALSSGEIKPLAWFDDTKPLRSGWAWGQSYLSDKVTAFVAKVGEGKLYAFGPEITFRGQAHGTFKMLFNQLYK